jgi:DNA-directed RNA polymerase specialized sigma24 family protein
VKSLATDLALEELSSLLAFFYRRVGNRPDARDLTQQVAMRALPRLCDGSRSATVRSYLFPGPDLPWPTFGTFASAGHWTSCV